jgi:PAS domain S-box-containing protein
MTEMTKSLILAIEDDRAVLMSLLACLEDGGYRALGAADGREGLRIFREEWPDVVLLDLRIPEIDGLEVLAAVQETSPDTPVVIISGTGSINDVVNALRLGAWDFLTKPIPDMCMLLHAVQVALERSRLIRESRRHRQHLEEEVARRTADLRAANEQLAREVAVRAEAENKAARYGQLLTAIVATVPDVIYRLDAEGRFTFVSQAIRRYGYQPEDLLGRPFLELVHPEDQEAAKFRLNDRRTGRRATRAVEVRLVAKAAAAASAEAPVFLIDAEGIYTSDTPMSETFVGTQGIARDITRQKIREAGQVNPE